MSHPVFIAVAAAVLAVVLLAPVPAAGQAPTAAAATWNPPRTPDGQPDIQGFWDEQGVNSYDLEEGMSEAHRAISGIQQQNWRRAIVDPADGKFPYQPWAAAKKKEIKENYLDPKPEHLDPAARCFLDGVPRLFYQSGWQFLQPPGHVVILYEYQHGYRIIPVDGRPHTEETVKLWMGDSRGHWEGNTLVVDVTNNNDQTWFDVVGSFHSDALHIVERYTFVDADRIDYEATIEDPKVYTRPFKIALNFARNKQKGFEQLEHACYEGERSVENMLRR